MTSDLLLMLFALGLSVYTMVALHCENSPDEESDAEDRDA